MLWSDSIGSSCARTPVTIHPSEAVYVVILALSASLLTYGLSLVRVRLIRVGPTRPAEGCGLSHTNVDVSISIESVSETAFFLQESQLSLPFLLIARINHASELVYVVYAWHSILGPL